MQVSNKHKYFSIRILFIEFVNESGCFEHEGETFDFADAKQSFLDYLDRIASFLDIKLGPEKDEVEVYLLSRIAVF